MMKKIQTNDNSITFHNDEFDESYHSSSGAAEEAMKKFVEPCKIAELAKTGHVCILDVCFGLGYNTAAAIDELLKINPDCIVEVIGLENDTNLFEEIQDIETPFTCYDLIKDLNNNFSVSKGNVSITILVGDAREEIKKILF